LEDTAMKQPYAYVLYIDRGAKEHLVSGWQSLDDAEAALRDFAATIFVGPTDDEIIEALAEEGIHARIYALTEKRGKQISVEVTPFQRRRAA
jgi:hypothetical protein